MVDVAMIIIIIGIGIVIVTFYILKSTHKTFEIQNVEHLIQILGNPLPENIPYYGW